MPFYFTCPYCMHKTLVSEQLSGQSGPCVECGKQVTIPASPAARRTDISPAEDAHRPPVVVEIRPRRVPRWLTRGAIYAAVAVPIIVVIVWMLKPTVLQLKTQRDVTVCKQNLMRIAKALNSYAADHGTYPPAVTYGPGGVPMHSWRVLLLPYLGEKKMFESYDMSKPWNASENSHMQSQIPAVYLSPASTTVALGESSYMLITGKGTLFPPGKPPMSPQAIPDGAANTILVVETNNRATAWTEPIDLDFGRLASGIGMLGGIGGSHKQGATAVLADGQPIWLPMDLPKSVIDGLVTPAGGEAIEGNWYK
jgi:Protein of unknown function (DUF1559)